MQETSRIFLGTISELWRYPVKTMQGEMLNSAIISKKGLVGDRSFALVEKSTGRIISAKNPRKWKEVFNFSTKTLVSNENNDLLPKVSIEFADGETVLTDDENVNEILSNKIGHSVSLVSEVPKNAMVEKLSLEDDETEDSVSPVPLQKLSPFKFFDGGPLHLLTTDSLNKLKSIYRDGDFEPKRFRPNIVIDSADTGFDSKPILSLEQDCMLQIGDTVKLNFSKPTERCIITTLAQAGLPKDNKILKTIDRANGGNLGFYTQTLEPGNVRVGDSIWMIGSRHPGFALDTSPHEGDLASV